MLSLYESILNSTNSGKLAMIKEWAIKNIGPEGSFTIGPKGEISTKKAVGIDFDHFESFPPYIKFEDCLGNFDLGNEPDRIIPERFPAYAKKMALYGSIKTLPSFKIDLSNALVCYGELDSIKPITLNFVKDKASNEILKDRYIDLSRTGIDSVSLHNIKCTGLPLRAFVLKGTKVEKEVCKELRRLKKEYHTKERSDQYDEYLNEYFHKYWPELASVDFHNMSLQYIDGVGWLVDFNYKG